MKIGLIGCGGRMGKSLIEAVHSNNLCKLVGGVVRPESTLAGMDLGVIAGLGSLGVNASSHMDNVFAVSDVVIDFSAPDIGVQAAKIAAQYNIPLVTGTTGYHSEQLASLKLYASSTPILWSANMSIGVNVLAAVVKNAAAMLGEGYDAEIVEMHHCHKVDAPSGTALLLGEAIAKARGVYLGDVARKSRDGLIGARKDGEIGFSSVRGGDVVGEHVVMFAGDGERIELIHKASHRKIFSRGAVKAALWIKDKEPSLYTMEDVL